MKLNTELNNGSDRSCAIILPAGIDLLLAEIIPHSFVDLSPEDVHAIFFDPKGVLAAFSARVTIAYALGIIDDQMRRNLDSIRRIRNAFAHSPETIGFDHPLVAEECSRLDYFPETPRPPDTVRGRFIECAMDLYSALLKKGLGMVDAKIAKIHRDALVATLMERSKGSAEQAHDE